MAVTTSLPFASTYLCEVDSTTMTYLKGKCRNALNIYALLRVTLSSIEPQLNKQIEKKPMLPVHYTQTFEQHCFR